MICSSNLTRWVRIGRSLVEDVAERAALAGARYLDVTASPNALGFYQHLGFEIIAEATTRFAVAPRMALDLSHP
jgi:ribosomal protein S18 acetylase RimI-like enzyme